MLYIESITGTISPEDAALLQAQLQSDMQVKAFWEQYRHAEIPLGTWYQIVSKGSWSFPADVKVPFGNNVDFVGDNRAIFDIGGDRYRLVVHFAYEYKTALIKFVGTHEEYDITNAKAA